MEITIQLKKVKRLTVQAFFHKSPLPPIFCLLALASAFWLVSSLFDNHLQSGLVNNSSRFRLAPARKNIDKSHQEAKKKLRELATQEFACQLHALAAATRFPKIGYQ